MSATDPMLQLSIAGLGVPGVSIGRRIISIGDENALLPEEMHSFANSVTKVRRASGAARIVFRELLAPITGRANDMVPKGASGAPIWPHGVVGSLAHDSGIAIAAIGKPSDVAALGIDIEPTEMLPRDLVDLVATPRERLSISANSYDGQLLFVAKEAVYKAVYALDHEFLDHHDVEINFEIGKAFDRYGRTVELRFCISTHFVVLAHISFDDQYHKV
jgi:4'-phosphopantetheinyl transferase EntD